MSPDKSCDGALRNCTTCALSFWDERQGHRDRLECLADDGTSGSVAAAWKRSFAVSPVHFMVTGELRAEADGCPCWESGR